MRCERFGCFRYYLRFRANARRFRLHFQRQPLRELVGPLGSLAVLPYRTRSPGSRLPRRQRVFLSTAAGRARITAAWNTGSEVSGGRHTAFSSSALRQSGARPCSLRRPSTPRTSKGRLDTHATPNGRPARMRCAWSIWTAKRSANGSRPIAVERIAWRRSGSWRRFQ